TPYFFATLDTSFNASTERVAGHIAAKATSNVPIHSVVGPALWLMVILSSWCLSLSVLRASRIVDDTSTACTDRHRLAKGMASRPEPAPMSNTLDDGSRIPFCSSKCGTASL